MTELTQAARDVLAERQRQISAEGWTPEHDDEHAAREMAAAAGCYALQAAYDWWPRISPSMWPWDACWWKPTTARRDLVKAGALILAEIERLDRAAVAAEKRCCCDGAAFEPNQKAPFLVNRRCPVHGDIAAEKREG